MRWKTFPSLRSACFGRANLLGARRLFALLTRCVGCWLLNCKQPYLADTTGRRAANFRQLPKRLSVTVHTNRKLGVCPLARS